MKRIKYILSVSALILSFGTVGIYAQPESEERSVEKITVDSLEINNTNLFEALNLIAVNAGLKIIVDPQIEGKVSLYLKNVNVADALRIILEANEMAFSKIEGSRFEKQEVVTMKVAEGKTILGDLSEEEDQPLIEVMTEVEFEIKFGYSFSDKIQTRIISLVYSKGDELLDILNQMKGPSGKVIYNEQTNALILIDEPDKLKAMTTVVREWDVPIVTKRFYLKYVKVAHVIPYIKEVLNPNTSKVDTEEATNSLIVTDKSLYLKKIEDLIKQLDVEERHVLIETKILQIILNDEHQEGIDWEAIVSNYQSLVLEGRMILLPRTKAPSQNFNVPVSHQQNPKDNLSLGTISEEDYAVLLDALDTVGNIHIISNTKFSTVHNQTAELMIKALSYQSLPGRTISKEEEIEQIPLDPEMKFQITTLVNSDETLTLNIEPEQTFIKEEETQHPTKVNIKVQQGSTVVMGGLFKETMVELREKIPLLGDIPILGLAFRHQGPRPRKAEIVVFLTPKVVVKE